jgi:hypothetical protein
MKRTIALSSLSLALGASQAWADCEKIAYVESVRTYVGANNHIFIREKGVTSPLFVANSTNANIVRGALQAHVHRMPVLLTTSATSCPAPSAGLWTSVSTVKSIVLAP